MNLFSFQSATWQIASSALRPPSVTACSKSHAMQFARHPSAGARDVQVRGEGGAPAAPAAAGGLFSVSLSAAPADGGAGPPCGLWSRSSSGGGSGGGRGQLQQDRQKLPRCWRSVSGRLLFARYRAGELDFAGARAALDQEVQHHGGGGVLAARGLLGSKRLRRVGESALEAGGAAGGEQAAPPAAPEPLTFVQLLAARRLSLEAADGRPRMVIILQAAARGFVARREARRRRRDVPALAARWIARCRPRFEGAAPVGAAPTAPPAPPRSASRRCAVDRPSRQRRAACERVCEVAAQRRVATQLRVTRQLAEASELELIGDGVRERPKPPLPPPPHDATEGTFAHEFDRLVRDARAAAAAYGGVTGDSAYRRGLGRPPLPATAGIYGGRLWLPRPATMAQIITRLRSQVNGIAPDMQDIDECIVQGSYVRGSCDLI